MPLPISTLLESLFSHPSPSSPTPYSSTPLPPSPLPTPLSTLLHPAASLIGYSVAELLPVIVGLEEGLERRENGGRGREERRRAAREEERGWRGERERRKEVERGPRAVEE